MRSLSSWPIYFELDHKTLLEAANVTMHSTSRRKTDRRPDLVRLALQLGLIAAYLTYGGGMLPAEPPTELPNILLIYTDDQGYGDAGSLNDHAKFKTPNLDRLAHEGVSFTDAHTSDTVCTPSRYGLLTGRYAWRTKLKRGVYGAEIECLIPDERMTLASLLRDHGYATAMVGKWHLGMDFPGDRGNRDWSRPVRDMPLDKGFEYFYGIPASLNYGVLAWFEGRFAKVPPTLFTTKKPNLQALSDYRIEPPYQTELNDIGTTNSLGVVKGQLEVAADFVDSECLTRFTDQAIDWIDQQTSSDSTKPFFLYLPYTSPHKPVIPIERFRGRSGAGPYGDFMMETDWHVGRLLQLLDRKQLADNTIVIFSSDNGPENTWRERTKRYGHRSNGQFREGKRSIYEGGHRVPMFIRWPAKIPASTLIRSPVCQTDLLATFAEMLGRTLLEHEGEDSVSLYSALTEPTTQMDRDPIVHHSSRGRFAIRHGDWKLIMSSKSVRRRELYNLSADPGETNNLIDDHPDLEARMTHQLTEIVARGRTSAGTTQPNDTPWWDDLTWMRPTR